MYFSLLILNLTFTTLLYVQSIKRQVGLADPKICTGKLPITGLFPQKASFSKVAAQSGLHLGNVLI